MRFAILTDDSVLAQKLAKYFEKYSITIDAYCTELLTLRAMRTITYDLVLLDAKSTVGLASSLLSWRNCNADFYTPAIILTSLLTWNVMQDWIEAGAHDVVSRMDVDQIGLRVCVALRRLAHCTRIDRIQIGDYVLNRGSDMVACGGIDVSLTPREFSIAWLLFSNPGKFLSRSQITTSVWGNSEEVAARSLEQHIYKLRKKLGLSSTATGASLKTVYALGYKLEISPDLRQTEQSVPGQLPALVRAESDDSDACNSLTT
ncbi:response regulator transcription factor [Collimonas sp. OK412]|jgi:DNA-binding response OmpR family regulator|uniref:response regulator transcription factor n=1 Tax=Collimonas sp. (strain OK412) TaxID=1801619 RepID=UPI0008E94C1C|nr:response regulator transcription factor [Collimonas sp. OK412]SFC95411.1 DNA-binding response regulator, OmpR family, contains REC and winged-helix (wHTH) domain [Collimonas sp. OK412]